MILLDIYCGYLGGHCTKKPTTVIDYSHLPSNALTAASVRKIRLPKLAA